MIPFIFVNKITERRLELFADDTEGAEVQLQREVPDPQNWTNIRTNEEDPIGLNYFEE
jgi:hypothetical protein